MRPATMMRTMLAALAALALTVSAQAAPRVLEGQAIWRERIALPPGAELSVRLTERGRPGAEPRVIARTRQPVRGQGAARYRLAYDDRALRPGRAYELEASVSLRGDVWFEGRAPFTRGSDGVVLVRRSGGAERPSAAGPQGEWLAEDIRGRGVLDRVRSTLRIAPDGAVSGRGGCNGMGGRAEIRGERIRFGQLISTQMACPPAVMRQEQAFFAALGDARSWRVDRPRRKLILLDGAGRPVATLAATN
ncbi:putative lipoprotein [Methylopila jiangsuensis]|nr:META domain-containing protein [Methylopila jiangsuensis]MDR6284883.1 putative lipoprotein [Methylopila jiangsuensis]